ncbi:hypothetical protein THAOC_19790 [Thalassiosira oceanica]|uniref:Uncharacterized protein n=1 Tax=Thalassiosira oceanica TaxID=159749 RepID=K0SG51_THAOC|nr:hypothetical protein THAOC_19790 [Thalassiosira oceanica]|eukprot:EJK59936.1 hypothetical protein THAOC_19790 [Thalassiosira oceanica]
MKRAVFCTALKLDRHDWNIKSKEVETNQQRCTPADEANPDPASCDGAIDPPQPPAAEMDSVATDKHEKDLELEKSSPADDDGDNGPPVPISTQQQQEQLAFDDEEAEVHESALSAVEEDSNCARQQKMRQFQPPMMQEQLALGDEEVEVHESALSFVVEDSDRAPIPIQQQKQQLDDAKRKAKAEISTANGARGRDERDSTTKLVAEETDEDLRPIAAILRVGESLGEVEEEAGSSTTPRPRSGPSLCLADCDDNDPPVPIQQQEQLLALDDKAVKNKMKQEAKAEEQKSVMTFVDEEGGGCAPIPVQQQIHQFDDAKEKTASEISMASGESGIDERDSVTEPTTEEMEEGEVNLRPDVRSRVGASWGELEEGCVEVSSMPAPQRNDAADARLAPEEEIPIYDGIAVHTVWTRLQTWIENFQNNPPTPPQERSTYNPRELIFVLVITSVIIVGIVLSVFVKP